MLDLRVTCRSELDPADLLMSGDQVRDILPHIVNRGSARGRQPGHRCEEVPHPDGSAAEPSGYSSCRSRPTDLTPCIGCELSV